MLPRGRVLHCMANRRRWWSVTALLIPFRSWETRLRPDDDTVEGRFVSVSCVECGESASADHMLIAFIMLFLNPQAKHSS